MSSLRSKRACQLSIRKLALESNASETWLHTFTFADPEPTQVEAQRRFHNMRRWFLRHGRRFVWAIQRGGRTNRIHFHAISCERWDSGEMWGVLRSHGFGRYDVQPPKPVSHADYIARYIARGSGITHGRKWGVVGFKGVRGVDVVTDTVELTRVTRLPSFVFYAVRRLSVLDDKFARRKNFLERRFSEVVPPSSMNELKKHQEKQIVTEAQNGAYPLFVGEYRGLALRSYKSADKLSGVETNRTTVEHTVLVGSAAHKVTEFLPPGADGAAVTPAAQVGEVVLVRVSEWRRNQSGGVSIRGFITPLLSLA